MEEEIHLYINTKSNRELNNLLEDLKKEIINDKTINDKTINDETINDKMINYNFIEENYIQIVFDKDIFYF